MENSACLPNSDLDCFSGSKRPSGLSTVIALRNNLLKVRLLLL